MTLFHLKRKLLKALGPIDRLPGPPLHVKAHHGPFGQWNNPEHLQTLQVLGLKVEDSVLDYGCGAGRMAEHLFKWGYGYPGYFFVHVKAGSELYADNQEPHGVWVKNKQNMSAIVAYSPDLFRKLCDGWEVTYSMGRWRDMDPAECSRRKLPYQDYAILTR